MQQARSAIRVEREREEEIGSAHSEAMVACRRTTSRLLFPSCMRVLTPQRS